MIEQLDVDPCSCDRSMGKGYEARELLPARAAERMFILDPIHMFEKETGATFPFPVRLTETGYAHHKLRR